MLLIIVFGHLGAAVSTLSEAEEEPEGLVPLYFFGSLVTPEHSILWVRLLKP